LTLDPAPHPDLVRDLFAEYGRDIGVEIDIDPSAYGLIVVAMDGTAPAGCVALRPLNAAGLGEIKRLYVRPPYRGTGLGRRLVCSVIDEARRRSYSALRLDTLPQMQAAIAMYQSLGFRPIPAYHQDLLPGMLFFELMLTTSSPL
jgi:putative acetyltransferase